MLVSERKRKKEEGREGDVINEGRETWRDGVKGALLSRHQRLSITAGNSLYDADGKREADNARKT